MIHWLVGQTVTHSPPHLSPFPSPSPFFLPSHPLFPFYLLSYSPFPFALPSHPPLAGSFPRCGLCANRTTSSSVSEELTPAAAAPTSTSQPPSSHSRPSLRRSASSETVHCTPLRPHCHCVGGVVTLTVRVWQCDKVGWSCDCHVMACVQTLMSVICPHVS